eukprot:TRINITY_DN50939_c0_g1_i1.p1 TRINITY_DN50939_c0_g1~~TRINITY_DN50939_c0_g1_i1.p1  ORF type:complete len:1241 (+),score=400.25 TRINITY_DN50939_c0_g1_i1:142-3864(+)
MAAGDLGSVVLDKIMGGGTLGSTLGGLSSPSQFNLQKQRETLAQLRREVEALDEASAALTGSAPSSPRKRQIAGVAAPASEQPLVRNGSAAPVATLGIDLASHSTGLASRGHERAAPRRAAAAAAGDSASSARQQQETRHSALFSELEAAEDELQSRAAAADVAKAEWSRALHQAASCEGRTEKRLNAAKQEHEEACHTEMVEQASFRQERDKLRQRVRNLRMQLKQAERHRQEAEQKEALNAQFPTSMDDQLPPSPRARGEAPSSAAAAAARGYQSSTVASRAAVASGGGLQSPRGGKTAAGREAAPNTGLLGYRRMPAPAGGTGFSKELQLEDLRQRREELLLGERDLRERERSLRKASGLTDREVEHWHRRAELQKQADRLKEEHVELRMQLRVLDEESNSEKRKLAQARMQQEQDVAELGERERQFQEQRAEELQALQTIDAFLESAPTNAVTTSSAMSPEERRTRTAEWIEADICARQVAHVKWCLAEIVADASARAQVLEQAVAELHADLDRRAAIILELVERQSRTENDVGEEASIEREALQTELQHQRGVFDLRGEQVQGLEQRLAALLAREAPRVHALREWISVHEPLSQKRLQSFQYEAEKQKAVRSEVEAMRQDKAARLAHVESEYLQEKRHMLEATSLARLQASEGGARAGDLHRQREELLRSEDRLLKAESNVLNQVTAADQLVERDQRRLVDLTARQLRASSAAAERRGASSIASTTSSSREARAEPARRALQDAREAVEEARSRQISSLTSIQQEADAVRAEIHSVTAAVESIECREYRSHAEASAALPPRSSPRRAHGLHQSQGGGAAAAAAAAHEPLHSRDAMAGKDTSAAKNPQKKREADLELSVQQLRHLEHAFEAAHRERLQRCEQAQRRVEEAGLAHSSEQAQQRASSAACLKRFRAAQSAQAEVEKRIDAMQDALQNEESASLGMAAAAAAGSSRQRLGRASTEETAHKGTRAGREAGTASALGGGCHSVPSPGGRVPVPSSAPAAAYPLPSSSTFLARALPSLSEVKELSDRHPERGLYGFYLQVLPLLKGASVEILRRSQQRYVARQLLLSSDLQRVELWPATGPASASESAEAKARPQKRIAEAYVRVEALERIHVPKATLSTVQRLGSADLRALDASSASNGSDRGGRHESPRPESRGPAAKTPNPSPGYLQLELILTGVEPWKLAVPDVHGFHAVSAAIGALTERKPLLPEFAVGLGIGAPMPSPAAALLLKA